MNMRKAFTCCIDLLLLTPSFMNEHARSLYLLHRLVIINTQLFFVTVRVVVGQMNALEFR